MEQRPAVEFFQKDGKSADHFGILTLIGRIFIDYNK